MSTLVENSNSKPRKRLPARWETERFIIQDAGLEQAGRLTEIFNACTYVGAWDPTFQAAPVEALQELIAKGLSMAGDPEKVFQVQCFRPKAGGEIFGYTHFTLGAPVPGRAWISMFVIDPARRREHCGSEVAQGFLEQARGCGGLTAVRLRVYLKNWPALRFWIGAGFTCIVKYEGDPVLSEGAAASLVLEKIL